MKKVTAIILSLFITITSIYSENYKILKGIYNTKGNFILTTTKGSSIERNYPLDKKTIFTDEELENYLQNYHQQLKNSRFFEEIDVSWEKAGEEDSVILINVLVSVVDSNHFLAVPYANFKDDSSATKLTPKIKAKDTNFLGTMNPLTSDLNIEIKKDKSDDFWTFEPGFTISYDFPFKAGPFDFTWVNDYGFDFIIGDSHPEWNIKSGLKAVLPLDKISFELEMYQYWYGETDYIPYDDYNYGKNSFIFSTPVSLYKFKNYTYLKYTPSASFSVNYDINSINDDNISLKGPDISFSHKLHNSKINWNNNFRQGYSWSITNNWPYNFFRKEWSPSVSVEGQYFNYVKLEDRNYLDAVGLAVDFYAFTYFNLTPSDLYDNSVSLYGEKIGSRIRGVPDDTYFGNEEPSYTTSTAIVMNIDLPVNIITTCFKHDIINFDMQFSPFMDIAIYRDRALPLQTDSIICAGMEVLVYPYKWSSFTIRGSIGFDLKSAISENNAIKGLLHNKEISIGLGLHY